MTNSFESRACTRGLDGGTPHRHGRSLFGLALLLLGLAAGPTAGAQAPKVSSTTPANGATGVAITNSIVFVFDQPMDTDVPIIPSVPPFLVGNLEVTPAGLMMNCDWSDDARTLTCLPTGDLPPNTTIRWTLNPSGALFEIASQSGVALATTSGTFTTGAGGGGGENAPKLVSSTPANDATDVAVTSSVVFVFDKAMQKNPALGGVPPLVTGAVAWLGSGLDPAKFSYNWSADGKQLTCDYAGDLPGNTTISWTLNPPGSQVKLESDAQPPVPLDTTAGSFTTGQGSGGCDPGGVPDTWGSYGVSKFSSYVQTSTADPVPMAESAFLFTSLVASPQTGAKATAGSITLPDGTRKDLTASPVGGFLFYTDEPASEAALDAAYPAGEYTLRFTQTGQPEWAIPMPMPAAGPPIPKITNFTETQAVNPAEDFTLQWNAYTGAAANDGISLSISESTDGVVFQAPDPCVPRELPVTATSIVIPAGTLQTNKTYTVILDFTRPFYFSTNAVPEMSGFAAISRSTESELKTGTGGTVPADPARFTAYQLLPNGNPELTLIGTATRSYNVLRSGDIAAPAASWTTSGTVTMNAAGQAVFEDTQANKTFPLFYRAVAN